MSVVANVSADHGIGFVVGSTDGYGLGYNRYLDNGYGWQISGFPYVEEDYRNSIGVPTAIFLDFEGGQNGFKFAIRPYLNVALMYRW